MTHAPRAVAALIALVAMLALASPASAASGDPRAQREEVRRKRAQVAAQVDALKADQSKVVAALDALDANVRGSAARLTDAERAAKAALVALRDARAAELQTQDRLKGLRRALTRVAVDRYMHPVEQSDLALLGQSDLESYARGKALLAAGSSRASDTADALRVAERDLGEQRAAAEAASTRAERNRSEVQKRLGLLQDARTRQAAFAGAVEGRLNASLSEAASLAVLDSGLSAEIARRDAELAAKLRTLSTPAPSVRVSRGVSRGGIALATVRGITVAASIADNLSALLSAADADGISLGGAGYRDSSDQVATRRANCGSSDYDIYDKPASQCSPPTAPPGTSMHEQGLAIDFTQGGQVIRSRGSSAYRWLAANAGRFGFQNLPSEAWHWSTNGR